MCQSKHYMFTANRHVPSRNKENMRQPMTLHIAYTNSSYFLVFVHSLNILHRTPFLLLVGSNCNFLLLLLICLIYITSLYFIMARGKLPPIFTPNTLESMIEYTFILSIMDKICEITTKPWQYPRNDIWLLPLQHLLEFFFKRTSLKKPIP